MKITILGSSSSGNGYVLQNEKEALIIEAGVKTSEIKKAVNFQISKIQGVLISHEHLDHAKYADDYIKAGLQVFMSKGTAEALTFKHSRKPQLLLPNKLRRIGNFKVLPFKVEHDAAEPLGFFINHKEIGNLLFLTDTYYSAYRFKNLNHLLVEANYCQDIVEERVMKGRLHTAQYRRLMTSHMSIQTCKELLRANDLTGVQNIILIHLSDSNSNATDFKQQVQALTGLPTTIADKGVTIEL